MKLNEWKKAIEDNVSIDCFIEDFLSYDSGYWCDVISDVANAHTDIYYCDLKEWLFNNLDAFDNYVRECGYNEKRYLFDNVMCAQFEIYNQTMNDCIVDIVQYYIINMFIEKGITELPKQLEDEIEWIDLNDVYNNDFIEDTIDKVNEWIDEYKLDCKDGNENE